MKRCILTGTPGCGKTSILRALELKGYLVIGEAATDIIAYEQALGNVTPWKQPVFIDQILGLQKQREEQIAKNDAILQFYDRSPICTYALAMYLGFKPSVALLQEIERIERDKTYERKVFFIENLGYCTPTDARTISFEEALVFEEIHAKTYAQFGYECVMIPPGPLLKRVNVILRSV